LRNPSLPLGTTHPRHKLAPKQTVASSPSPLSRYIKEPTTSYALSHVSPDVNNFLTHNLRRPPCCRRETESDETRDTLA
jgi:hypothetical protein